MVYFFSQHQKCFLIKCCHLVLFVLCKFFTAFFDHINSPSPSSYKVYLIFPTHPPTLWPFISFVLNPLKSIYAFQIFLDECSSTEAWSTSQELHLWKISLLSHQLTIANSISARGGVVCPTPFSALGFVCHGLDRCCYAITVTKFTWTPPWCIQKTLLPFSHSSPLACTLSPLLL